MHHAHHDQELTRPDGGASGFARFRPGAGRTSIEPLVTPKTAMHRYPVVAGAVLAAFLALFLVGDTWGASLLADPALRLRHADVPTALVGVGLLVADAVLPVPASLVMIAHGAAFGLVAGTLLSLVGSMGAALIGFGLGRRGGPLLTRFVPPAEQAAANRLLERHGALAIVVTRPIPLLAETVAVLAGASPLGWGRAALAALAGSLPAALIYALTGAAIAGFGSGALVFVAVVAVTGGAWLVERRMAPGFGRAGEQTVAKPAAGTSP